MKPPSGNGEKPPQPTFPYTWVSDAQLDFDARYLIKGLIEPGSFTLIYGPSGSGKSFFTADIAQHVATDQQWRGRKVNQHLVVYVASEAGGSILRRFIAWRDNRMGEAIERIPLAVLTRSPNLIVGTDGEKLKEQLAYMQDEAKQPLGWVVFDTLSRAIPGGDENNAEDMTRVIGHADDLRDTFKCATGFVHHSGKDATAGARGHSSLFAAADLVIRVSDRLGIVEKIRDGVSGEQFPFSLQPVDLGTDADGDEVTTCLLSHDGTAATEAKAPKGVGANQRIVLDQIKSLVAASGVRQAGTSAIPNGVLTVQFETLLAACSTKLTGMAEWRKKQYLASALISLQGKGAVGVHNEFIWLQYG